MFTEQDYLHYFEQIGAVERRMIYMVNNALVKLNNPQVRASLRKIAEDEVRHYSYILGLFKDLLEPGKAIEHRMSARSHSFGEVNFKKTSDNHPAGFKGYCANISLGGMCLESTQSLNVGDALEIKIRFYEQPDKLAEHTGKIAWVKEVISELYVYGVEFKT